MRGLLDHLFPIDSPDCERDGTDTVGSESTVAPAEQQELVTNDEVHALPLEKAEWPEAENAVGRKAGELSKTVSVIKPVR